MQGFNRVTAVSLLISGQALLEIAGTLAVFLGRLGPSSVYLHNMGLVTLLSAFIAACVGSIAHSLHCEQFQQAFVQIFQAASLGRGSSHDI